jgi:uncharacterized small protein (DUF1192 family)
MNMNWTRKTMSDNHDVLIIIEVASQYISNREAKERVCQAAERIGVRLDEFERERAVRTDKENARDYCRALQRQIIEIELQLQADKKSLNSRELMETKEKYRLALKAYRQVGANNYDIACL